jgi:hypothetical protein
VPLAGSSTYAIVVTGNSQGAFGAYELTLQDCNVVSDVSDNASSPWHTLGRLSSLFVRRLSRPWCAHMASLCWTGRRGPGDGESQCIFVKGSWLSTRQQMFSLLKGLRAIQGPNIASCPCTFPNPNPAPGKTTRISRSEGVVAVHCKHIFSCDHY